MIKDFDGWGFWIQNMGCTWDISNSNEDMDVFNSKTRKTFVTPLSAMEYLVKKIAEKFGYLYNEECIVLNMLYRNIDPTFKVIDTRDLKAVPKDHIVIDPKLSWFKKLKLLRKHL